jgi:GT2 family glycosyltransferase
MLTIVIVSYNCPEHLFKCLSGLKDLDPCEIIVVDNAPNLMNDPIKSAFPNLTWIQNQENLGFAKACNIGAKASISGSTFLFLNPDTVPESRQINNCFNRHIKEKEGQISSILTHPKLSKHHLRFPGFWDSLFFGFKKYFPVKSELDYTYIEPDWVSGSFLMIDKSLLEKVGYWSEDYFMYYEDMDLCKKVSLHRAGRCKVYLDLSIEHVHGGASRKTIEIAARSKAAVLDSQLIFFKKFFPKLTGLIAFAHLKNLVILSIFRSLSPFSLLSNKIAIRSKILAYYNGIEKN